MSDDRVSDPDLHLLVGGHRIEPTWRDGVAVFGLKLPAADVRLASLADRPCDLGINADSRHVGYAVRALQLRFAGQTRLVPASALHMIDGFHHAPAGEPRWTNGDARLPDAWFAGLSGEMELAVEGFALAAYRRPGAEAAQNARLFMGFENIGENCDFSIAQHHFNAEPASLLRWGSTDRARLMAGIRCGFEGIGDPAHTMLYWHPVHKEYKLRDHRYLSCHTWARTMIWDIAEREKVRLAGAARLRLLARKFMADLREARRIYVFKPRMSPLKLDELRELHATLREVGPACLLAVDPNAAAADVGRVDDAGDGLYLGHIDRLAADDGGSVIWREICAATRQMVRMARQAAPDAKIA